MNDIMIQADQPLTRHERVDWYSLFLLLMLTVPAAVMAVIILLFSSVTWVAQVPYTSLEVLGSFAALLLAIFVYARYKKHPATLYISAGLIGMGIIEGFLTIARPQSDEYIWLHSLAGTFGGVLCLFYAFSRFVSPLTPRIRLIRRQAVFVLGFCTIVAFMLGILSIVFSGYLPQMTDNAELTTIAWMINTLPVALFLSSGIIFFYQYRKTGAQDLFLFTAIVIFLFQASEVFYFAHMWGIIWWFWQGLRLLIYLSVLGYVLKEYIQTSESLAGEMQERQKAEIALRKAEADWRNSFNSLDDVMLIIDRDYAIERVNESGLTLLDRSLPDAIGKKCYREFHNTDKPCPDCPCRRSFRYRKVAWTERYEEQFSRHFAIKSAPIMNGDSMPHKCVCLMRDISHEVKAREKEQKLQQELNLASRLASIGEVAAGIAHEINNPLTGVIGFAQLLATMNIPDEMREAVEVIQDGARRTAGIVQKLLTFARRSKSSKEYLDINVVLRSTIDIRAYEMRTNNIEISSNLAPDLPGTMANFGQLQQVFLNLIINAEQAIGAANHPGKIIIRSEKTKGKIRVTMVDNGVGISRENIPKLFDPFFTTKSDNGGTGLGLSISYGIIKEHGGTIKVKSTPGDGAIFIIDLPVIADEHPVHVDKPLPVSVAKKGSSLILVVDDEVNICRVLDRLLTREGHEVDITGNAATALDKIKNRNYDLILLDMKMPGMSGIDLYQHIKTLDSSFCQKLIFITGDIISARNRSFLEESRVPFVTKPFTGDVLMNQVKSVLGGIKDA